MALPHLLSKTAIKTIK